MRQFELVLAMCCKVHSMMFSTGLNDKILVRIDDDYKSPHEGILLNVDVCHKYRPLFGCYCSMCQSADSWSLVNVGRTSGGDVCSSVGFLVILIE